MFDARYVAFAALSALSALLVISPGAILTVVVETAEHMGRPAVRRTLEGVTGAILAFLGARLLL